MTLQFCELQLTSSQLPLQCTVQLLALHVTVPQVPCWLQSTVALLAFAVTPSAQLFVPLQATVQFVASHETPLWQEF